MGNGQSKMKRRKRNQLGCVTKMTKNQIKRDEEQISWKSNKNLKTATKETDHSVPVPEARPNLAQRFSAGSRPQDRPQVPEGRPYPNMPTNSSNDSTRGRPFSRYAPHTSKSTAAIPA